ncbi:MAG: tellurite resistance TerB family protein [Planctomycetales bacterium]|nr:tellurite resistance TerB family protein [Planctomycetales bacterium]
MVAHDNLNCLKNLLRLMCCDGTLKTAEKAFLSRAAKEMAVLVEDWNALLKSVLKDPAGCWPIEDRTKAAAALKAIVVMAKADGQVDEAEKEFALQFAKAAGISKDEWRRLLCDIDAENLFEPFQTAAPNLIVLTDNFDKLDAFLKTARDNGVTVETTDTQTLLQTPAKPDGVVCFHAAPDKDATLALAAMLLEKTAPHQPVCILTRFEGNQVKYLHEAGIETCIIEPANDRDLNAFRQA